MKNRIKACLPLIVLFFYLLLSFTTEKWSLTWIIIFSIPIIYTLMSNKSWKKKLICLFNPVCLAISFFYLINYDAWSNCWIILIFILLINFMFLLGKSDYLLIDLGVLTLYLALGFSLDFWHPGWVLFLLIPILHILFPKKIFNDKYHDKIKVIFKCKGFVYFKIINFDNLENTINYLEKKFDLDMEISYDTNSTNKVIYEQKNDLFYIKIERI